MMYNKEFIIIFLSKIIQVIILVALLKVSTSLLNPKEMGVLYIFTTSYTCIVLFLLSPVGQYINRRTHSWYEQKILLNRLIFFVFYCGIIAFCSIPIGLLLYGNGVLNTLEKDIFIALLCSFVFFVTLNQTIIPIFNMLEYRLSFAILTILTSLGMVLFSVGAIYIIDRTAESWLFGLVNSYAWFSIIGFLILNKRLKEKSFHFSFEIKNILISKPFSKVLQFVIPLSIATFFMWFQNQGYRFVLEKNLGLEFVGFFGVGIAIVSQISSVIESIATQYYFPNYYKNISENSSYIRTKAINILLIQILPLYFALAIFLTFSLKYIVQIMVSPIYYESYIFAIFGAWVEFFRMSTNLLGTISQSEMNTRKFMMPYIVGAAITGLLVTASSLYAVEFIPFALLFSGVITFILMYIFMYSLIQFQVPYNSLIPPLGLIVPLGLLYLFDGKNQHTFVLNSAILLGEGIIFMVLLFYMYKKGLSNDNS